MAETETTSLRTWQPLNRFPSTCRELVRRKKSQRKETTPNLFSLLGVTPTVGRGFAPDESKPDSRVAVLSYGLWQRRFGGDRQAVGKQILLNGDSYAIVGILPADFSHSYTSPFMPSPQVWVAGFDPSSITGDDKGYGAIARLNRGVTLQQAQTEMDTIAHRVEQKYPDDKGWGVALSRALDKSVEYTRPALLVLWVAVLLVLLIACANLGSLLLARGESRSRELAVRIALGASQGRILRQLLTESVLLALMGAGMGLLLALMGAGMGLLLAAWSTKALLSVTPPILLRAAPGLESAGINPGVLGYCLMVAIATGLLFGLAPAVGSSKTNVNESLKESGQGSTEGRQRHGLRGVLVVSEFALALVLLVGAGLMIKTLVVLSRLDLGFDRSNVLTMKLSLLGPRFRETAQQIEFLRQLLARLNALPGVQSASVTRGLPIEGWSGWNFITEDNPSPAPGEVPDANYNIVGPQYFRTLRVPLQRGRPFTEADTDTSLPVVIVSEQLAIKSWPGMTPSGSGSRSLGRQRAATPGES
jgi:predicted permease